jgi:O-methyltransferase involved in polyketide biosynthesis
VTRLLDLDRPVAVIVTGVLPHLADEDAAGLLNAIWDATVPGSWLAVTHPTADVHPQVAAVDGIIGARPRSQTMLDSLLAGWQLDEPGLTWATECHPDPHDTTPEDDTGRRAQRFLRAAVARRPTGPGR